MDERIGNAHRTTALDLLSQALEQGYLELSEFEQRMVAVNSAKTSRELIAQTEDMPAQFRWDPRTAPRTVEAKNTSSSTDVVPIVALCLGAASIFFSLCFGVGILMGGAAIITGRIGMRSPTQGRQGLIGFILGIFGALLSAIFLAIIIFGNTAGQTK